MSHMDKYFKIMLVSIFIALISGSMQDAFAMDMTDIFKPVPIKNSEYQFHLQVVLRDADGGLISVVESTNGYYIPHDITDQVFDNDFGEKEVVIVDNVKYEKVKFTEQYSLDLPYKLMFFIPIAIEVNDGSKMVIVDANIFQAFVPFVYLEADYVIDTQWTILRESN